MRIPILVYHKIDPKFEWGITRTTPGQFKKQIALMHQLGYRTISFKQLFEGDFNSTEKCAIITFDDAYQSVVTYAFPIMQQYGFSATIFAITDYVGKKNFWDINLGWRTFEHLDWKDIRKLSAAGWEIGSHTATHPDLTTRSSCEILSELGGSRKKIEDETGKPARMLAYPFGRFNDEVIRYVEAAGYRGACTMRFGFASTLGKPFLLPRLGIYLWDPIVAFQAKVHPTFLTPFEGSLQYLISFCARGTILANRLKPKKSLQFF